jgi:16S rRNA (guanine966-N2)-methyltransferase
MSRIVAGRFRGRRLEVPAGRTVRPTTDRMRERVFSMLMHGRYPDMHGARVADLFAGTGALGLEALSRGAEHITFVEKATQSIACIRKNIGALKADSACNILQVNATSLPQTGDPFDFIFMDPPYHQDLVTQALEGILAQDWLAPEGVIICELGSDETLNLPSELDLVDERTQGAQRIIFASKK